MADSDFRSPPAVLDALAERVRHGIFGYTAAPDELRQAIVERMQLRYGWRIEPSWIVFLPGVVPGLHLAARRLIAPGERALVPTGLAVALPPGYAGFVVPRSGLALRHGVSIVNTPGIVDAGYRGEVMVLLINHDPTTPVTLERGDRIAQLVIQRVERAELIEIDELPPSDRGAGGFGSTGS